MSWHPQPMTYGIDAFSLSWSDLQAYAFPPFTLIQRCLGKIRKDQGDLTMVAPYWPTQPWFPALLELACEIPLVICQQEDLLVGPIGQPYPLLASGGLLLTVWRLSGANTKPETFRRTLANICWPQIVPPHLLPTRAPGTLGMIGVYGGIRMGKNNGKKFFFLRYTFCRSLRADHFDLGSVIWREIKYRSIFPPCPVVKQKENGYWWFA